MTKEIRMTKHELKFNIAPRNFELRDYFDIRHSTFVI